MIAWAIQMKIQCHATLSPLEIQVIARPDTPCLRAAIPADAAFTRVSAECYRAFPHGVLCSGLIYREKWWKCARRYSVSTAGLCVSNSVFSSYRGRPFYWMCDSGSQTGLVGDELIPVPRQRSSEISHQPPKKETVFCTGGSQTWFFFFSEEFLTSLGFTKRL